MPPAWQRTDAEARLTRMEDAKFPELLTFAQAQAEANFVVMEPSWLPSDCAGGQSSFRVEQPPGRPEGVDREALRQTPWSTANPCSLRTIFQGRDRAFRIKQFLYDWAPPAAGVAPLWDSPELEPFECGGEVGWRGLDYRSAEGACFERERTQIEFSVLEGAFSRAEIAQTMCSIRVADQLKAAAVRSARFHELNYWVRYRFTPMHVPYGLFRYAHARKYAFSRPLAPSELAAIAGAGSCPLPCDARLELDSAVAIEHEPAHHYEVEAIFWAHGRNSVRFWCTSVNRDSQWTIELPPLAEPRSCQVREPRALRGTTVWVAALTRERGPWEAMWEEDGCRYAVWSSALSSSAEQTFLAFIEGLNAFR
jgi:hypothetical protein